MEFTLQKVQQILVDQFMTESQDPEEAIRLFHIAYINHQIEQISQTHRLLQTDFKNFREFIKWAGYHFWLLDQQTKGRLPIRGWYDLAEKHGIKLDE